MDPTKNDNHVKWYLATQVILSAAHVHRVQHLQEEMPQPLLPILPLRLGPLSAILIAMAANPSNPVFNHNLFEVRWGSISDELLSY